ncbi:flotillin domain-containing protein [Cordyceps militaris CM01]|uniref:Flotillin domain-containing protein n=1 Tax=Cordyceps militaris (strain CM01) TaxID=983644 RepID=G3JCN0_CORMM|nr:flotillin domain-containing protein [Cordyceps militaris CM01]EGX93842.1 flotillin domain-containing protein [Cordyceps militaris CM01]
MSYKISAPDEFLAITGMGIVNVKITKAAWVWPMQRCTRFSVQPQDYAMDLLAMTKEKLQFALPVVFTVGPDVNSRGTDAASDALTKYVTLLSQSDEKDGKADREEKLRHVANIVKGIIEGETRVLVSSMTMEEIFTEREMFKKRIFRNIQGELDQFGLRIWNSNVKELKDAPNSNYFESLSRKAHEGATNQARIDVAEAQLKGNVGESARRGEQEREIAKIHAETAVAKTERDIERATAVARLSTQQAALDRDVDIAKVTAQRTIQSTDEELKKEMEMKRAAAELERLRATDLVKATIIRESKQQAADAAAYEVAAAARAQQEARQREADADAYRVRQEADAAGYATQQLADADIVRRLKEAEGLAALAEAYAKMAAAFGGPAGLLQWVMLEKGTFVELAQANADAIRGLEPKISVWNTGSSSGTGNSSDPAETMRNVYQMLPPLMSTINEQTGITLPEWQFGKLAAAQQALQHEGAANAAH